jgi:hypothetical protein
MKISWLVEDLDDNEDLSRFGVRLLCPQGHGVIAVREQARLSNRDTRSAKTDFIYSLMCGCTRQKDISTALCKSGSYRGNFA